MPTLPTQLCRLCLRTCVWWSNNGMLSGIDVCVNVECTTFAANCLFSPQKSLEFFLYHNLGSNKALLCFGNSLWSNASRERISTFFAFSTSLFLGLAGGISAYWRRRRSLSLPSYSASDSSWQFSSTFASSEHKLSLSSTLSALRTLPTSLLNSDSSYGPFSPLVSHTTFVSALI